MNLTLAGTDVPGYRLFSPYGTAFVAASLLSPRFLYGTFSRV